MKILVTGANGQLGKSIKKISINHPDFQFIFTDVDTLNITNFDELIYFFKANNLDICINAAAYTNVDGAETETDLNNSINVIGPRNLSIVSKQNNVKLIHISSDYVYNNNSNEIMTEKAKTNPLGKYAESKLEGEKEVMNNMDDYFIVRTSWLYSEFGNNFVKTMLRLGLEKENLNVVDDQIGSPTYATDLAEATISIIKNKIEDFGIYNYSNIGFISWYEFAKKIISIKNLSCIINPIPSSSYPTISHRPLNSRMSKDKIIKNYQISIPKWEDSLRNCMNLIK